MASAAKVIHEGDDELVHVVERVDIAVSAAAKVAGLPKEVHRWKTFVDVKECRKARKQEKPKE